MAPRLVSKNQSSIMRRTPSNTPKSNPLIRRNSSGKTAPKFFNSIFPPKQPRVPLFSFGLVADIQYALKDPQIKTCKHGPNGKLDRRMGWSESLAKVSQAVDTWNKLCIATTTTNATGSTTTTDAHALNFVLSLGDIIEGNESYMEHLSERELKAVLQVLNKSTAPVKHIVGNHCRRLSKPKLLPLLGLDKSGTYYSFRPVQGWTFICLDTTEICGAAVDSNIQERTIITNAITAYKRPDHMFHGMISEAQLGWLASTLAAARDTGDAVIIATHYPLKGARTSHLALNSAVILDTIERSGADVVAVFAGHDHSGASNMPETKDNPTPTAFITVPGLVESPANSNAFATVSVFEDGSIEMAGYGTVPTHRIRRSSRRNNNKFT